MTHSQAAVPHMVEDLETTIRAASDAQPLARSAVPAHLLQKATIGGLLKMALTEWAWILGCWALIAFAPVVFTPLAILVIAGRYHALGILMHDASHMPLRTHTFSVRVFEAIAGFPLATTLAAMRYHHVRHHRDSGMATDPYFKAGLEGHPVKYALNVLRGLMLIPAWTLRAPIGLISLAVPSWRNAYGRYLLQDRSGEDLTHSKEVIACARAELSQFLVQLLVICALVTWPQAVLLGYVAPITLTGILAAWRLLREHNYRPTTDRKMKTIIATTNDHWIQWWAAPVLAPRNIGYHVVHHLHPQASLTVLPELRKWYLDNTAYADIQDAARKAPAQLSPELAPQER